MPKSLKLSALQAEVYDLIEKANGNEVSLETLAKSAGFSTIETKSICLVLIARKLIEKRSSEGRLHYRLR